KVIEEAPAPGMDAATREAICAAAVRAAKAVDYEGAGTIEFIADASEGLRADRIFFMEMNTRLQVEHPVTEEITGIDLVEWQLRVASGEPLPKRQEELSINGHAIEARLYAEDPAKGFLPSIGTLEVFDLHPAFSAARIDTGVECGATISPFYDPMIAKVIGFGETREEAISNLEGELLNCAIWPVASNAGFLVNLLRAEAFTDFAIDTGFIDRNLDALVHRPEPSEGILNAALRRLAPDQPQGALASCDLPGEQDLAGFRLNAPTRQTAVLNDDTCVAHTFAVGDGVDPVFVTRAGNFAVVPECGFTYAFSLRADGTGQASAADGAIIAPMPGKVIAVDVAEGQAVTAGQRLMVLEAMKMEHALTAPFDGVVEGLAVSAGGQVQVEAVLCRVVPAGEA
ncbi:MAG: biotin/lipoyl-containing protein, partial [Novosphingobium sp.]